MTDTNRERVRALLPAATDDVLDAVELLGLLPDDVASDLHRLRTGATTPEQLTELLTAGADCADHDAVVAAAAAYVAAVCLAAGVQS